MAKALMIIESAYRGTIEEQDDTIVWITHAMKGAGADLSVLLRGNAVNYAVKGQEAGGLSFGEKKQTKPPNIAGDVDALTKKGVDVYVVEDDVALRGLERTDLIEGLKSVSQSGLPKLFEQFDRVWHW
jgi:sulfur transfer complex TusBCD TusB component (DsrH family)